MTVIVGSRRASSATMTDTLARAVVSRYPTTGWKRQKPTSGGIILGASMTDYTPEQLRSLANGPVAWSERPMAAAITVHDLRVALREAAAQIEELQGVPHE